MSNRDSLFERAARVFPACPNTKTSARLLRLDARSQHDPATVWQTVYHQCQCFLDGGRRVLLRNSDGIGWSRQGGAASVVLDLTTGEATNPFPAGYEVVEVCDGTGIALLVEHAPKSTAVLWDMHAEKVLASVALDGWEWAGMAALADDRRAVVAHYRGKPYNEPAQSRLLLLTPGEPARAILEADQYYCNHIQGCPTDPNLYSYDRWASPKRNVEQVIHVAAVDGSFHEMAKLDANAPRPVDMFGVRDHYVWTPDGKRIVSYLNPAPFPDPVLVAGEKSVYTADFNHFQFPWILSALDWQTGEDFAAPYPAGRWGGHMNMTPDSRYIVAAGGPGFDCLFAVDMAALRQGWNEHIICHYPRTVSHGKNSEPFAYPFVLPDYSGVIFNAGWPGPTHGVYLAEWPKSLR